MTTLNVHLNFDGQCEAAFTYYAKNLGAKIENLQYWGDSPKGKNANNDWQKKVIHATLRLGDQVVMGGDAPQGYKQTPSGFSMMLTFAAQVEAEKAFMVLAQNGKVMMPLEETYWARVFGMVTDQFGIPWGINCLKPM